MFDLRAQLKREMTAYPTHNQWHINIRAAEGRLFVADQAIPDLQELGFTVEKTEGWQQSTAGDKPYYLLITHNNVHEARFLLDLPALSGEDERVVQYLAVKRELRTPLSSFKAKTVASNLAYNGDDSQFSDESETVLSQQDPHGLPTVQQPFEVDEANIAVEINASIESCYRKLQALRREIDELEKQIDEQAKEKKKSIEKAWAIFAIELLRLAPQHSFIIKSKEQVLSTEPPQNEFEWLLLAQYQPASFHTLGIMEQHKKEELYAINYILYTFVMSTVAQLAEGKTLEEGQSKIVEESMAYLRHAPCNYAGDESNHLARLAFFAPKQAYAAIKNSFTRLSTTQRQNIQLPDDTGTMEVQLPDSPRSSSVVTKSSVEDQQRYRSRSDIKQQLQNTQGKLNTESYWTFLASYGELVNREGGSSWRDKNKVTRTISRVMPGFTKTEKWLVVKKITETEHCALSWREQRMLNNGLLGKIYRKRP